MYADGTGVMSDVLKYILVNDLTFRAVGNFVVHRV